VKLSCPRSLKLNINELSILSVSRVIWSWSYVHTFSKRSYTLGAHCILLKQFILQKYIYLIILLSTLNFLRLTIYDYIILNARSYSPSPPICKGGGRGVLVGQVLFCPVSPPVGRLEILWVPVGVCAQEAAKPAQRTKSSHKMLVCKQHYCKISKENNFFSCRCLLFLEILMTNWF
jgi:hypothetical protein